jgi:hypothetical protein
MTLCNVSPAKPLGSVLVFPAKLLLVGCYKYLATVSPTSATVAVAVAVLQDIMLFVRKHMLVKKTGHFHFYSTACS